MGGSDGVDPVLDAANLAAVTGWTPKPEGWCRGAECIPASFLEHDFGVVAVAIDETTDDVAPFAEGIDFPVLVDTDRRFADTYGLINVPTIIWLDSDRKVVRDPSPEFADDIFTEVHGIESGPHLEAVRRWVITGDAGDDVALNDPYPGSLSEEQRRTRAEFRLALELARAGHDEA
ncbi:MAG: TlpA family protein disulfide reductase, partial [Microthrixaceae bacterium]